MSKKFLPCIIICYSIISVFLSEVSAQNGTVTINSNTLSKNDLKDFERVYGITPQRGNYWYDSRSGAFGSVGGPATGVMFPGHDFGPLDPNISNGNSGVYVNGRQLQRGEAILLARLFGYPQAVPGRYWLEASGNMGMEGHPLALGNIYLAMAQNARGSGSTDNFWSKGLYSSGNYYTGAGGQPSIGYVSVPGYGPVSHGIH